MMPPVAPTRAPAALAELAAAELALALTALDASDFGRAGVGFERMRELGGHRQLVTRIPRNPHCRFDHRRMRIRTATARCVGELLAEAEAGGDVTASLPGHVFVGELRCPACGAVNALWRPLARLSAGDRTCRGCGALLAVRGFELHPHLATQMLAARCDLPLAKLGLAPGDVVTLHGAGGPVHLELPDAPARCGAGVAVLGCGAIGSHLCATLARSGWLRRAILVDFDGYEPGNLAGQAIEPGDLGRPKALVQAERMRRIEPRLEVHPQVARLEAVPWGQFRGTALVSCLDNRGARQRANEIAFRLGVPLFDAAIDAGDLLTRVTAVLPDESVACLECAWGTRDYELLEQRLPCAEGLPPSADAAVA